MTYRPGKFTLSAGAQVIDNLYLSTGENARTSNYTLIDMRIAYRPLKWLEVFAKGDNLSGQKYETMLGYPMPGNILMGGISLNL